jgi:hypothetical protein
MKGREIGLWYAAKRGQHPPGLKGREIGMWYAARSKGKNKDKKQNVDSQLKNASVHFCSADLYEYDV